MRRTILALTAVGAIAAGVAPVASAAAPAVVHLSAPVTGLRFVQKVLHAHPGKIKIEFKNNSMMKHNVYLEHGETELGHSATIAHATASVVVTLKAGKYNYYCHVPGHEDAGMHGTLIVS